MGAGHCAGPELVRQKRFPYLGFGAPAQGVAAAAMAVLDHRAFLASRAVFCHDLARNQVNNRLSNRPTTKIPALAALEKSQKGVTDVPSYSGI